MSQWEHEDCNMRKILLKLYNHQITNMKGKESINFSYMYSLFRQNFKLRNATFFFIFRRPHLRCQNSDPCSLQTMPSNRKFPLPKRTCF